MDDWERERCLAELVHDYPRTTLQILRGLAGEELPWPEGLLPYPLSELGDQELLESWVREQVMNAAARKREWDKNEVVLEQRRS